MMIEKSGSIRLKDIPIPSGATPEQRELALFEIYSLVQSVCYRGSFIVVAASCGSIGLIATGTC